MIVLDFFGLPGSGKSTLSNELKNFLEKQHISVCFESYVLDHEYNSCIRKVKKLFYTFRLLLSCPIICVDVINIIAVNKNTFGDMISAYINLCYKLWLAYVNQNKEYVIFDEGFTQSIISLSLYNSEKIHENFCNLINILGLLGIDIKPIYVDTSVVQSIHRMNNRSKHDSRAEKTKNYEKKLEFLMLYRDCVTMAKNVTKHIEIKNDCDFTNSRICINELFDEINKDG